MRQRYKHAEFSRGSLAGKKNKKFQLQAKHIQHLNISTQGIIKLQKQLNNKGLHASEHREKL